MKTIVIVFMFLRICLFCLCLSVSSSRTCGWSVVRDFGISWSYISLFYDNGHFEDIDLPVCGQTSLAQCSH